MTAGKHFIALFVALVTINSFVHGAAILTKRHEKDAESAKSDIPMFIVAWKSEASDEDVKNTTARAMQKVFGSSIQEEFQPLSLSFGGFRASGVALTDDVRADLEKEDAVAWIEPRITVTAFKTIQLPNQLFNLDIADGVRNNELTAPDNAGENVDIYVLDTGIFTNHTQFSGRATLLADFSRDSNKGNGDPQGHGTHVSGTCAGTEVGIANKAKLFSIRVLNSKGSGSNISIVQGIKQVAKEAKKSGRRSVLNMSIGGPASKSIDSAVAEVVQAGVVVVVAAGNESQDACNVSPARSPDAITVAASDRSNGLAKFSNFGKCVDIVAPGVNIVSASNTDPGTFNVLSGTSMASPLVASSVATLLSQGIPAADVRDELLKRSDGGVLGDLKGSPNRLINISGKAKK